eukprot:495055-Pelagomonas_calceolata.AAC.2
MQRMIYSTWSFPKARTKLQSVVNEKAPSRHIVLISMLNWQRVIDGKKIARAKEFGKEALTSYT